MLWPPLKSLAFQAEVPLSDSEPQPASLVEILIHLSIRTPSPLPLSASSEAPSPLRAVSRTPAPPSIATILVTGRVQHALTPLDFSWPSSN